ncbi:MAG TPA: cell division protein FtsZ [Ktedonobacteraceae bacterium]|nr:cell division protein FtsZ [Ktedonobacteraceae bacterium]
MQPMSHDNASRREHERENTPEQWVGKADARPEVYERQEDQWAVLRHEVEGEDMRWQAERTRQEWDQRDTGDDDLASQTSYGELERALHHVDIVVVGVGGAGTNAVNRMISTGVRGVRFVAMNTDGQALNLSAASSRICLGQHYTKGLGAGGNAAVGKRAATESAAEIRAALGEPDLVFIASGMGGGTGTGAAPVVASIAKKLGALTVGIVTIPFAFEGSRRRRLAEEGLAELSEEIDALITVPNDRLLAISSREHSLNEAFKVADDVLRQGVQGIAEVINVPGMVNVDFADVRSVLFEAGTALMSIGQGSGRNRAQRAAEEAIAGGFLNVTIRGAQRVLFNISGGEDMTLFEINEVAERIGAAIDSSADIIFGAVIDPSLRDTMRVTLIAAGMEENHTLRLQAVRPEQLRQAQGQTAGQGNSRVPFQPQPQRAPSASSQPMPGPAPRQPENYRPAGSGFPPAQRVQPAQSMPPIPPAQRSSRPAEQSSTAPRIPVPPVVQPVQPPAQTRARSSGVPERPRRSLDDLRGIRGMARRQEALKGQQPGEEAGEEVVDIPPYLKRYT